MNVVLRTVIHFLPLKTYNNPRVLSELEAVYGHGVMTLRTVERGRKAFTQERPTLSDAPRPRRPLEKDMINVVKQTVGNEPFFSQTKMAQRRTIYYDVIKRILIQDFELLKMNFCWISRKLDTDQTNA
jgi:hypothetical protein